MPLFRKGRGVKALIEVKEGDKEELLSSLKEMRTLIDRVISLLEGEAPEAPEELPEEELPEEEVEIPGVEEIEEEK